MIWAPVRIWLPVGQACHPRHECTRFRGTCLFRKDGLTVVYFVQIGRQLGGQFLKRFRHGIQLTLGGQARNGLCEGYEEQLLSKFLVGVLFVVAREHLVDILRSYAHQAFSEKSCPAILRVMFCSILMPPVKRYTCRFRQSVWSNAAWLRGCRLRPRMRL